ncbi:choice-of-anchor D domain-containing protein [Kribbella sp. NPDC055071]
MSRIPRVPTAIITAAALLAAGLAVLTLGRDASAADQLPPSVGIASDIPGMSPSYRNSVSSDGRWVAWETADASGGLWVTDMGQAGTTQKVGGLDDIRPAAPSMSGDAGLIALIGDQSGTALSDSVDPQLYAVNRRTPASPVLTKVTGTPNDLPYQRMVSCRINTGDGDDDDCAPKLSRDGTTLVAPVYQSIESGQLDVGINGEGWETDRGLYPVLNFGAFGTSGTQEVELTNTGKQAIIYPDTGPVIDGDSTFTVTENTCAATLQPGATCFTKISFSGNADCTDEGNAVLQFNSTNSAAGQTAFKLTGGGECPRLAAFPPRPAAAAADPSCTGPSEYTGNLPIADDPHDGTEGRYGPWFSIGSVGAGELNIDALAIQNTMASEHTPVLTSAGCALKLVKPAGATDACTPDQPIPPHSSCTAYVESRLPQVGPFSARIQVGDTAYSVGGHAVQRVIAAWRDPSASGNFGKASVVSVTGAEGTPMDGLGPTVSADGRWVGYVSNTPLGRPQNNPNAAQPETQVYLHDTDSAGDKTYKPGGTTLVSLKTDGSLPLTASEPTVSDDGTRISFTSWEPVTGAPNQDHFMQVYVRDVPSKKSVLASAGPDGTSADSWTQSAVLSGDGYTLDYISDASNLGVGTLPGGRVIARDLTKDFAGGRGTNELISLRPNGGTGSEGWDRFISIGQDGTKATFASTDILDQFNDADTESDIYQASRHGSTVTAPDPLDLGTAKVGTAAGPQALTVTNDGTVPVRYEKPSFGGTEFAISQDQCTGLLLRPGRSCSYLLSFTPSAIGFRQGSIHAYTDDNSASANTVSAELTGHGTSDARTAGETKLVSTNAGDHLSPAISDNGQYVAYRTGPASSESFPNQIDIRNQATTDIKTVGTHGRVGPPAISADGSRVAYNAEDGPSTHVVVADGSGTHQITGTTSDLTYQRSCDTGFYERGCRPDIAGDGKTVAFGALLDAQADNDVLDLTLEESDGSQHRIDSLIDLGNGAPKTLQVDTSVALTFKSAPTLDPNSGFFIENNTCEGDLAANSGCQLDLRYNACAGAGVGTLRLNGTTPQGQAAIALVAQGTCIRINSQPAVKAAAACTPIAPPTGRLPSSSTEKTSAGNIVAAANPTTVGQVQYLAAEVVALPGIQDLKFVSKCDFALVTPATPDPNRPRPCVDGERLPANVGCTAYVGYRPDAVDVSGATMNATGSGDPRYYRFSGSGINRVILTRTDPAGDATFAGPPEIASKDSDGTTITGEEPSLSGDGRYLAFSSDAAIGRPAGGTFQIYRRDRTTGTTILVSQLSDGQVGPDLTDVPSISSSGDRVAFYADGYSAPNFAARKDGADGARATTSARPKALAEGDEHPSQIWARDIPSGKTILVSAAAGKPTTGGNGWSDEPSISDDGSTVGYSSSATDLVTDPGNDKQGVYVRYLDPDFAGAATGERFNERVSLTDEGAVAEDGDSRAPSLSSDGAFTAFDSNSDLVANTVDDGLNDVFVRRRPAQLVVTPASADFGPVPVGKSSSARSMVVKNLGPGPVAAGPTGVAAPFIAGTNVCSTTLHRGESCPIDARFVPTTGGPATGVLTTPSRQGYLPGPSVSVGLTGTGTTAAPVARWTVTPAALVFPSTDLGKAAPVAAVKVQNTGDVPLDVAAALTSSGDFGATLGACATVTPGVSCDVPVTFAPRKAGTRTGGLVLTPKSTDAAVASPRPATVTLTGVGASVPGQPVASMTVAPQRLVFGPQLLTTASAPKSIVVTNTGTVPLRLMAVTSVPDFVAAAACGLVQPGKSCAIPVRFVPTLVGTRMDVIRVAASAVGAVPPFPVPVIVSGTAPTPTLTADPPTARPNQIVMATGTNFPPGRPVVVTWDLGLGAQPVVADATGKFTTAMLVFRRDALGQRILNGTVPGLAAPVQSAPVLIMPLSYQPPNFVLRW